MKLSIIVSIYNVAAYLRKCVDSLLVQNYDDYEIILVDDGSTDESGSICDEYVRAFEKEDIKLEIKCIHQENSGVGAARNAGIAAAKGDYICFVDSDDYWEPNVLAGLMAQIERDNLDVLRFRLQYVNSQYEVYNPYKSDPFKSNDYSSEPTDGVSFLNSRMNTQCYVWQFILRRDLLIHLKYQTSNIKNVLFTPGIYFEDTEWTPRMLVKAQRVSSTNTIVYNYLVREGSITNAVNRDKQKKVLDDKMQLVHSLQNQASALYEQGIDTAWYGRMISATIVSIIEMLSIEFYEEHATYLTRLQQMNVFPIYADTIKAKLINISPRLMIKLLHLKNRK